MKFQLETLTVDGENCAVLVGENESGIATVAGFKFEPKQTLRITEAEEPPRPLWPTGYLVIVGIVSAVVIFGPFLIWASK